MRFVFMSLVILLSFSVFSINDSVEIKRSELPTSFNTSITMNFIENETVYIERTDDLSFINVTFEDSTMFENNSQDIFFNFLIDEIYIFKNMSYNVTFIINNSANNITLNYTVFVDIIFDDSSLNESKILLQLEEPYSSNGTYAFRFSTNTLPLIKKINYKIRGSAGEVLYIDCFDADVLTCPTFKIFDSSNMTDFDIEAFIPYDYSKGIHKYKIQFRLNDTIIEKDIIFEIVEADISFKDYVFNESCFKKVDGADELAVTIDCLDAQQDFLIRQTKEYLEKIRTGLDKEDYCKDFIKYEDKFVVVANISKDIYDELQDCKKKKDACDSDYSSVMRDYTKLLDVSSKNSSAVVLSALDLIDKNNQELSSKYEDIDNKREEILKLEESKRKDSRSVYSKIFFVIVCLGIVLRMYFVNRREFKAC